ncbi:hypothetical protein NCCP2495_30660 [Dietzia sp. NCCP-2495]|uniref:hypothetical protein n=1 Tax=Dietzia sp. NCCP-2495 TaxID=2934675 RepID=UPI002230793F|nr:hypothetical protein [Dietzia sp. NCCP-2495]GLB65186.1 hypothetical protein NCCP2495_30660 [Dietzia sp. NCCP-2495]
MSYSVAEVRLWDVSALNDAARAVGAQSEMAVRARYTLTDGAETLDEGWDGLAAQAVIEAAEGEKRHISHLTAGLEDLDDALVRAVKALGPAVQSVRDRIAEAEAAGLMVEGNTVRPVIASAGGAGAGAGASAGAAADADTVQATVDFHAAQISGAVETVRSLDEHYGREIDRIAAELHASIPAAVDRLPIPGPDNPWLLRGLDAMTGAASSGFPNFADDLDPETRGKHMKNAVSDDIGSSTAKSLRMMGKFAGALGAGVTVYDGYQGYRDGETSAVEAAIETTGALGGGMAGGAVAGAAAGSFFGPVGTLIGAGIGAAVGSYFGQKAGDKMHEEIFNDRSA